MSIDSKSKRDAKRKKAKARGGSPTSPFREDADSLAGMASYLQLSEVTGQRMPSSEIARRVQQLNGPRLFLRLAEIAAALANRGDQVAESTAFTNWALARMRASTERAHQIFAESLTRRLRPGRTFFHEKGIYLLQSLALTEGSPAGFDPSDMDIVHLSLALNDYAADWMKSRDRLSVEEQMLADLTHVNRFNRRPNPVKGILRSYFIMNSWVPRTPGLRTKAEWLDFQRSVFGRPYSEHVERFLGPLALQAGVWKTSTGLAANGDPPVIEKRSWGSMMKEQTVEAEEFLNSLTVSAADAKNELLKSPSADGVVRFPKLFYRTPFVELEPGYIVGASPWLLEHQLSFGFWGQCLAGMKKLAPGSDKLAWFTTFGELFERYCRWLARRSSASQSFLSGKHRFLSSRMGGKDEVEDLVLVGKGEAALFSVKASMMIENDARAASSSEDLLRWIERFFFTEPREDHRGGAFRLLDAKVKAIRDGKHEPKIDRGAMIFPVILTYDRIGDGYFLTRWLSARLRDKNLLQQSCVEKPLVMDIDSFETLMGIAAQGEDVFRILKLCANSTIAGALFQRVVRQHVPAGRRNASLAALDHAFNGLKARIIRRLNPGP